MDFENDYDELDPKAGEELVSVILVAHKFNDQLIMSLRSVLLQDYQSIELVFVDNSRLGNLQEKLPKDIRWHSKIKWHLAEFSPNPVKARNTGIKAANGQYVAILDSDDEYLPSHISRGVERLLSTKANLYFCAYTNVHRNLGAEVTRIPPNTLSLFRLATLCPIGHSTVIFGRCMKPEYHDLHRRHDIDLWLRLFSQGKRFCWSKTINVRRYITRSSLSSNKLKLCYWQYRMYRKSIGATPGKALLLVFIYAIRLTPSIVILLFRASKKRFHLKIF